ncbi:glyoxylate reductase/hydroxypyruvate reductase isoform X2 [Leptopilina boulardi]|nr:glyoxylate reductase/hydroxypyruvate reductase isoform X2 [Leptopilina boulardi]XP_051154524.1 glyoxylate reductase/hydroxypyruvate reductase isoform X2 [Leptopilina boulardi]XP_051154525.1 glyoxylate reductase/hydroxypyruvate reductase isoform X2 [Leptopilina boulardi]XP_051154526.1 glyoxylate reductase/hydroxypyruvate reductase isoform X2 [Leptopilina boulardi]
MSRPKILVTRPDIPAIGFELLGKECDLIVADHANEISQSELLSKIRDVDGLYCLLSDKIDEQVLKAAGPNLKVVATMSVGVDHLDLKAMKERNILVGYTPGILTPATAELTVALLLTTSRNLIHGHRAIFQNEWKAWGPTWMLGPGLLNSTVGIVGLGRIGAEIAEILKGFKVSKILYTSRREKPEAAKFDGKLVNFDTLLKESDFVIVTIALTPDTKEMFNKEAFDKMKKTAVFINVSRGQVVHQPSLIEALKNKQIWGAGLDVTTPEPIGSDHELLKLDNCVVIPHLGSATFETRNNMATMTANNILAALRGKPEEMPNRLIL